MNGFNIFIIFYNNFLKWMSYGDGGWLPSRHELIQSLQWIIHLHRYISKSTKNSNSLSWLPNMSDSNVSPTKSLDQDNIKLYIAVHIYDYSVIHQYF